MRPLFIWRCNIPLLKGKSRKTISSNIKELVTTKPGKARAKGIKTLAKKRGISTAEAKRTQAIAISFAKAGKSKPKKKKGK